MKEPKKEIHKIFMGVFIDENGESQELWQEVEIEIYE
jgi:hypothetical protein